MGSIGPDYSNLFGFEWIIPILVIFLLAIEFQFIRNLIYAAVFVSLVYLFSTQFTLIWYTMLRPMPLQWSFLLPFGGILAILWFFTWLLWRRGEGVWSHICYGGWLYLLGASIYTSIKMYFTLQGFYHWIQILEFLFISLFTLSFPLGTLILLRRLGYRLPFVRESHDKTADSE